MRRRGRGWGVAAGLAVLVVSLAFGPGTAFAKPENHCPSPLGDDLNEVFATRDAVITPFCPEADTGDRWRRATLLLVAGADPVFPAGYVPSRLPPEEDFLAKLVSRRYVVDAGTRRERTYLASPQDLVLNRRVLPDGTRALRWLSPSMHPLPPGTHTVDEYNTLSAEFWDGLGLAPENFIPAGESLAGSVQFQVVKPK